MRDIESTVDAAGEDFLQHASTSGLGSVYCFDGMCPTKCSLVERLAISCSLASAFFNPGTEARHNAGTVRGAPRSDAPVPPIRPPAAPASPR